jgi:hypothetical protein
VTRSHRSGGSPASTYGAKAERRAVPASGSFVLALTLSLALFGCGTKQSLEQAIQCGAFQRGPDGTWSASKDVSLDYVRGGTQYQLNFSKGAAVNGKIAAQEPRLAATLDTKCTAKR